MVIMHAFTMIVIMTVMLAEVYLHVSEGHLSEKRFDIFIIYTLHSFEFSQVHH